MSSVYKPDITIGTHTFDKPRAILVQAPPQTSLPLKVIENRRFQAIGGLLIRQ